MFEHSLLVGFSLDLWIEDTDILPPYRIINGYTYIEISPSARSFEFVSVIISYIGIYM